jgi:two-component system response regulator CpxR
VVERVLMIDDDAELCEMVAEYLAPEGFAVEGVHDGASGVERVLEGGFSLVLLDVMLPRLSGFEVLRRIRSGPALSAQVPVLMLTARGEPVDRIVGLEVGADDYMPKPFNERELVARMRAILRRTTVPREAAPAAGAPNGAEANAGRFRVGDLEVDVGARVARRGGEAIELTAVEFELLSLLARRAGGVVTREEIAREVLDRRLLPLDRSIDTHVSHLRRKLGPGEGESERIKTVRGVGYVYALPERGAST